MFTLLSLMAPKPVAVMIHGAGGGGWEYKFWQTRFEQDGYRVIAPDLRPVNGDYAKTKLSDYVSQIVAASGAQPDVLIGASMGGVLVLKAAEQLHPRAIVLVCSTLPAGLVPKSEAKPYPDIIRWAGGPYSDTLASMPDSDEQTRRFAHPRWRDESGQVLNAIHDGVPVTKPECPVLSIIPDADDTIPSENQVVLSKWAKSDVLRFAGMSHVGPLLSTKATVVAEAVLGWLKRHK